MASSTIMPNKKTVTLVLEGRIPSKKNSRVSTRSGRNFPSKDFYDWQADAIQQVRMQTKERFYTPVRIDFTLYFGTLGKADSDNKRTSILDMLVEAFVLKDDNWLDVPKDSTECYYRKGEPGAVVKITEI